MAPTISDAKPRVHFIILHETIVQSWAKDAGTFALIVAVIGTGSALSSDAMQWLGFAMLLAAAITRAANNARQARCTPQQAADMLARDFGVRAKEEDGVRDALTQ